MIETLQGNFDFGVSAAVAVCCVLVIIARSINGAGKPVGLKNHWIHSASVTRFGGVCVLVAIVIITLADRLNTHTLSTPLLWSATPLVLMGLSEDFGIEQRPSLRIIAGLASGLIAVFLTGVWITEIEVPLFDLLLAFPIIAIPLSAFASTTTAHSFNLVDGLNGLCSGLAVIALLFFGALAFAVGDDEILSFALLVASCVLGFWIVNIATGRIFLGDAGAYFLGHSIAWIAILLAARYSIISPWALLLGLIYPISETLITIARRRLAGVPISEPDSAHLHHMIYKFISQRTRTPKQVANSFSSILILLWSSVPAALAFANYNFSITCFVVAVIFLLINILAYRYLGRIVHQNL